MSDARFEHLMAAQVALAKVHMEILDTEWPNEPNWDSVFRVVSLAENHLKAMREDLPRVELSVTDVLAS